ncbi:hypothetical protein B0T10DRAFT_461790 [Thelonectria olida]|uniref:Uncharacterized protein n=1 Tax=Thelonectria olida TaxID=1576542 RepID=A0A9P8W1A8_9HYPO|nr:hypothetical protein B0T10DRAFT_461790 [Thelonectria olida]
MSSSANRRVMAAEKRRKDDEFTTCKTPSQRASCDVDHFLEHYFLTNGQPDPNKTPEPLTLQLDLTSRIDVHLKAEKIPGLYRAGGDGMNRPALAIGWDEAEVHILDSKIHKHVRRRPSVDGVLAQRTVEVLRERRMEQHREFV